MRNLSFSRGSENLKWGVLFMLLGACVLSLSAQGRSLLSGKVLSSDKSVIDFATVYLKGTQYGCTTNEKVSSESTRREIHTDRFRHRV